MTKQEEIREGIAKYLKNKEACEIDWNWEFADEILSYLHSRGVVMKVDRELPKYVVGINATSETAKEIAGEVQRDMLEVGYAAVEPLIRGDNATQ